MPQNLNGYDLTGSRIWFHFQADANGPDAARLSTSMAGAWHMGEDLEPIVLFDNAKPGDKVLVAVKLLQTVDEKALPRRDSEH